MRVIEILETKTKRYIPSDLSECDPQQYMDMCELIFHYQNQAITYDELRTHAAYKLMDMVPSNSKINEETELKKNCNIALIADLIEDFFEEGDNGKKVIKQYYIHNPVPKFSPAFSTYYGPSDSFMNMTFGEYADALRLFHDFPAIGDYNIIIMLTAIFYRPKRAFHFIEKRREKYNGDIRKPYNSHNLEIRAKKLRLAPVGFTYGFYLLFASFLKYMSTAKIIWAGQEIDFSILYQDEGNSSESNSSDIPGIGMDSIAFSMAESGAFGNLEDVRNTDFWQVMIRMYDSRRTYLEQKQKDKNATTK
jgi:hypothetical protein